MERLSGKAQLKYGTVNCLSTEYVSRPVFTAAGEEIIFGRAADRLAAYEDTGLEPEEISEAANRRHDCKIDCLLKEYNAMMDKIQSLGGLDHLSELAQAERDGRLVVLEPSAKEGEKKPPCFYNDMGQDLCLGFGRGWEDDEPIDRCKECWYCEANRTLREEAEAELAEKGEEA